MVAALAIMACALAGCTHAKLNAALHNPQAPLWSRPAPDIYRVRVETTKGEFVMEVTRSLAPRGADRFYHLVQTGFYDDSRFFRVVTGRFARVSSIFAKSTETSSKANTSAGSGWLVRRMAARTRASKTLGLKGLVT